jgi:peptidoglycan/xylan/chitin deacetylase (PgdA/CDA1 family)
MRRFARQKLFARTLRICPPRPIVSFTFDDFPRSAVRPGATILEQHGVRGSFYAVGSYCGRVVEGREQYRAEDLGELAGGGHEIGCHTFHHQPVSTLTKDALAHEITRNAAFLGEHLPTLQLRTFAYPYGDASLWSTLYLQKRFVACRSSEDGLNHGTLDLGRLRAVRLYDRVITRDQVRQVTEEAAARNAWLIFVTHDVDQAPSPFGCSPTLLEHALTTALSAATMILPVIEVITTLCTVQGEQTTGVAQRAV